MADVKAHTVRCPVPTCDYAETVEPPVDYLPAALAPEVGNALARKAERMAVAHAGEHEPAEWWAACSYYVAHLDREVARSHMTRLRTGPAVWTQPGGVQADCSITYVGEVAAVIKLGGTTLTLTDPDLLAQVTMTQVRPA